MKMLWSGIRSIVNSKSSAGSSITGLIHNDIKKDSKTMADIFNNVFVNTAHKINEKVPRTRKSPLDYLSSSNTDSFFLLLQLLQKKLKVIINSMKNGKAIGPYSIPAYLLKILSEYIAVSLCHIASDFSPVVYIVI